MILFPNFDRQHSYETVRGLMLTKRRVRYVGGSYHLFRTRTERLVYNLGLIRAKLPSVVGSSNAIEVLAYCFRHRLKLRNTRSFSNVHGQFDWWVAQQVRKWAPEIEAIYCYQDYLPITIRMAVALKIPTVCEQIIDNSPEAQGRLSKEQKRAGVEVPVMSEQANLDIMRNSSVVVVPTDSLYRYVNESFPKKRVYLAPYGITAPDEDAGTRLSPPGNYIVVRANSVRKGSLIFLTAVKQLVDSGKWRKSLRLVFAGAFDAISQGAADSLIVAGVQLQARNYPHRELMSILPQAQAFVMPSLQEGRSLLALEAARYGIPLILSTHVGLEPGEFADSALFVSGDTPELWAETLLALSEGRLRTNELSRGALNIARLNPWSCYHSKVADAAMAAMGEVKT